MNKSSIAATIMIVTVLTLRAPERLLASSDILSVGTSLVPIQSCTIVEPTSGTGGQCTLGPIGIKSALAAGLYAVTLHDMAGTLPEVSDVITVDAHTVLGGAVFTMYSGPSMPPGPFFNLASVGETGSTIDISPYFRVWASVHYYRSN